MSQIAKPELDQILQQHKLWLETDGIESVRADLQGVNLQGVDLRGANLLRANLRGANLQGADLREAGLYRANLRGANLRGADLRGVDLWEADLRGAQFNTNICRCRYLNQAKFTPDALPWLILHPKWSDWKDSVRIKEAAEKNQKSHRPVQIVMT